jgi:hypothetical protein
VKATKDDEGNVTLTLTPGEALDAQGLVGGMILDQGGNLVKPIFDDGTRRRLQTFAFKLSGALFEQGVTSG